MDVRRSILVVTLLASAACAPRKVTSLFDDPNGGLCAQSLATNNIQNKFIVTWNDGHISFEQAESLELFKRDFLEKHVDEILHVEFNKKIYLKDQSFVVGDVTNANMNTFGSTPTDNWGPAKVEASAAWTQGYKGQGVVVGVVDTPVDYYHPQINQQILVNQVELNGVTGVDDDHNGLIDDVYGWDFVSNSPEATSRPSSDHDHGTHVSGIILADSTLGYVQGMAPSAKLIPSSFMDANGSGTLEDAIKAMGYAASRGAKVINASWGGPSCSVALQTAISTLAAQDVLFVTASGNEGVNLDFKPEYPSAFNMDNQLNVAATDSNDLVTSFSNTSFSLVHVSAPGYQILSTVNGGYAYMSGTSMAAPYVSGAAALLRGVRPAAKYKDIKKAIMNSVDVHSDRTVTRGRINVRKAVDALKVLVP